MSEFDGPVLMMAWFSIMPVIVLVMRAVFGASRLVVSFLIFNAFVLMIFCDLWYWGFYISERWMHIIDLGAPWSWLGSLLAASYAVSFFVLRKEPKAVVKSFFGPVITLPALWSWILCCALIFDPFP